MDDPRPEKVAVVDEVRERFAGSEAALLTEYRGIDVSDMQTLRRSLRAAGGDYKIYKNTLVRFATRDLGPSLIALKHGSAGASAVSAEGRQVIPGIAVDVVCGLGSGDAFTAAFGTGLLRGLAPVAAIERGNAAGAVVATRLMCSSARPVPAEIDNLLARQGTAAVEGRR